MFRNVPWDFQIPNLWPGQEWFLKEKIEANKAGIITGRVKLPYLDFRTEQLKKHGEKI